MTVMRRNRREDVGKSNKKEEKQLQMLSDVISMIYKDLKRKSGDSSRWLKIQIYLRHF